MSSINHFPPGFLEHLPKGKEDDHYGSKRYAFPASGKTERVIAPYEHKFSFSAEGGLLVAPVRVGEIQSRQRNLLLKLLVTVPEVNLAHVSLDRTNLLIVGSREAVQKAYPGATLEAAGGAWLVTLGERIDAYRKVQNRLADGAPAPAEVVDRRESLPGNLLTPKLRDTLGKFGEIVYESDPQDTDRLLICYKHFHGEPASPWELMALRRSAMETFVRHQESITESIEAVLPSRQGKSPVFLETFPEQTRGGFELSEFSGLLERIEKQAELLKSFHSFHGPDNRKLLRVLESDVTANIVSRYVEHGHRESLHGDGRVQNELQTRMDHQALSFDSFLANQTGGGVGVAADILRRKGKMNDHIFSGSHQTIVSQVAGMLEQNQTGFLVYGGGHFASGFQPEEVKEPLLEEYFSFLPRTQIVVVEPPGFADIVRDFDQLQLLSSTLSPEARNRSSMHRDAIRNMAIFLQMGLRSGQITSEHFLEMSAVLFSAIRELHRELYATRKEPTPDRSHADWQRDVLSSDIGSSGTIVPKSDDFLPTEIPGPESVTSHPTPAPTEVPLPDSLVFDADFLNSLPK